LATVVAFALAIALRYLEKQRDIDRQRTELNQKPIVYTPPAQARADWIEDRLTQADKEWLQTHDSTTAYAKADADIKAQEQLWLQGDEREREKWAKESQAAAEPQLRAHFYFHFGVVWLIILGVSLAISFSRRPVARSK
jgi:hypothetical protein